MTYFGAGSLYNSGVKYGERLVTQPLLAVCVPLNLGETPPTNTGQAKIAVTWGTPAIPFSTYRIMRGRFGFPSSPTSGVLIYQGYSGQAESTSTVEYLKDGEVAFYRMFSYQSGLWQEVSEDYVVATAAGSGHDALVNALPRMYTSTDNDPFSPPDPNNTLVRWLEGIGFWIDSFKNQAEILSGPVNNLHPQILDPRIKGLGIMPNHSMSILSTRRLLNDQANYLPSKTTPRAISMVASDITGWHCTTTSVMNLVPTLQDAAYQSGLMNAWSTPTFVVVGPDISLAVGAVNAGTSATAASAQAWANEDMMTPNNLGWVRVLQCLTANAGKASVATNFDTTSAATKVATAYRMVRVKQSRPYSAMYAIRRVTPAAGTPALANTHVVMTGTWYDRDFNVLGTPTLIPSSQPAAAQAWSYFAGSAVSPVGAAYLSYKIEVTGDNDETCHLGGIRVEEVTSTRTNLVLNPDPTTVATNWNPNLNQAATYPLIAAGSLQMKALAAGAMSVVTDHMPVTGSLQYGTLAHVTTTASRTVNLYVAWYDSTSTVIQTDAAGTAVINGTAWLSGTATAPYNAVAGTLVVEVAGALINETAQVLSGLFEKTNKTLSSTSYFSGNTNGVWGSTTTPSCLSFDQAPNPYRDPRLVNVVCNPARSNFVMNPSLEASGTVATGWTPDAGQTANVHASDAYVGTNSGSVVGTGAATQVAPWGVSTMGGLGIVRDSENFVGSVYARLAAASVATGVTARVGVYEILTDGTMTMPMFGPWTAINHTGYVRLVQASQTAEFTSQIALRVEVAGLGASVDDFRFDAAQLESGITVTDYFDANISSDAVWQGGMMMVNMAASHEYPSMAYNVGMVMMMLMHFIPAQTPYRVVLADSPDWANVRLRT